MARQLAECNIKVVARIRPVNKKEVENGSKVVVSTTNNAVVVDGKTFNFDYVFDPTTEQQSVYDKVAKPLVANVLLGYNATIFAYGQTSSGKTHTMEGVVGDSVFQGIIPRVVDDLFGQMSQADASVRFCVKVSYYEIYLEKIRDLLDPTRRGLDVREDRNHVPYVRGCTERTVSTPDEMMAAIEDGRITRKSESTVMNERSSRSHSLFVIKVSQENATADKKLIGKLSLVDLAGSEKVSKTGATGERLGEAKCINKSLSVLGKVINALSKGDVHIPYRESKLTRILQESIGGNSKTAIILCCSPASYNQDETKSTLYFGVSAKTIKNVVKINEELTLDEWKRLVEQERATVRHQNRVIESVLQELEKWRNGTFVPRTDWVDLDTLADDGIISSRKSIGKNLAPKTTPHATPTICRDISASSSLEETNNGVDDDESFDDQPVRKNAMEVEATFIAEKAVLLTKYAEAQCQIDKYKSRFECAKEQLGAVITNLETVASEDDPFGCSVTNAIDALRDIRTKLDGVPKDSVVGDDTDLDNASEEDDDSDGSELTSRQEDVNRQMEKLLQQITEKEELISKTVANADTIEQMRLQYEIEMDQLRQKIDLLQRERDNIQTMVKQTSNSSKVSESRRIRLQEVEKQLAEYRRKVQDLERVEKLKAQNEEKIKNLRAEVDGMKAIRVKLMRQMREDNERYRKAQAKVQQEMNQLRQQGKRHQYEVEKAKQSMDKQLNVYRRKYEEAAALNKRLQQNFEKQQSVRAYRFTQMQENAMQIQELKTFLNEELASEISAEEARICLEQLVRQRDELNDQLKRRTRARNRHQVSNQEPSGKMTNGANGHPSTGAGEDLEQLNMEIASLKEQISLRDTQITELEARLNEMQSKTKGDQRWNNFHTTPHAVCALKVLFAMATETQMEKILNSTRLADAETKVEELTSSLEIIEEALRYQERRCTEMEKEHRDYLDHRERQHQESMSFLLKELIKLTRGFTLTEESMAKVMELCDKVDHDDEVEAQLVRKDEEVKALKAELSKNVVRGRRGRQFFEPPVGATAYPVGADGDSCKDSKSVTSDEQQELNELDVTDANNSMMTRTSRHRKKVDFFGTVLDSTLAIMDPTSPSVKNRGRKKKTADGLQTETGDATFVVNCPEANGEADADVTLTDEAGPSVSQKPENTNGAEKKAAPGVLNMGIGKSRPGSRRGPYFDAPMPKDKK